MKRVQLEALYLIAVTDAAPEKFTDPDTLADLLAQMRRLSIRALRAAVNHPDNWPALNTFHERTIAEALAATTAKAA
jgi:hypothetical protein